MPHCKHNRLKCRDCMRTFDRDDLAPTDVLSDEQIDAYLEQMRIWSQVYERERELELRRVGVQFVLPLNFPKQPIVPIHGVQNVYL